MRGGFRILPTALLAVWLASPAPASDGVVPPGAGGAPRMGADLDAGLRAAIERTLYAVEADATRSPDAAPVFRARNRAQGLHATFSADGVEVRAAGREGEAWHFGLRLVGAGYGEALHAVAEPSLAAAANRVEYRRGGLVEWYVNEARGIEQGFTLAQRPAGGRRGERLALELEVFGGLAPQSDGRRGDLVLRDGAGREVLRYGELVAFDATGRALPAALEARDTRAGTRLRLAVDDAGAVYPVTIDPLLALVDEKLTDGAAGDLFGEAVAVSGDVALVGAPHADVGGNADQGAAYVFRRVPPMGWGLNQKLTASDGAANDYFGNSVALSGDVALVGAGYANVGGNGDQGAAYVFRFGGTSWSPEQKLTASDGAQGDHFGVVAVAGDVALVGAPLADVGSNEHQGAAYVFRFGGVTWTPEQKLTASDGAASDSFGGAVAVSGDAALVGADGADVGGNTGQGAAYVFRFGGVTWTPEQKLTASDGSFADIFGWSVALSGDVALVGAIQADVGGVTQGAAYVFRFGGATWSEEAKLTAADGARGDWFGYSVALSGDVALVGAGWPNFGLIGGQGAAYVFHFSGASWSEEAKLTASDSAVNDHFGCSVAVSGDVALVGAEGADVGGNTNQGAAYLFPTRLAANHPADGDHLGSAVAVWGDRVVMGAPEDDAGASDQGSATVLRRLPTFWGFEQNLTASDGAAGDAFGYAVDIAGDLLVVGAPFDDAVQGSAYVFRLDGASWSEEVKLTASDGAAGDGFGVAVAVSGDAVLVGAPLAGGVSQGAAYAFRFDGASWSEEAILVPSDGAAGDYFGWSLDLEADRAVIGSRYHAVGGATAQGAAYVFAWDEAAWAEEAELTAADGAVGDEFGWAVALSGHAALVGAIHADVGGNVNQGAAYVFRTDGTSWSQEAKLTASDGAASDSFGRAVALWGDVALVGSGGRPGTELDQGSAHLFEFDGALWSEAGALTNLDGAENDDFGVSVGLGPAFAVAGAPQRDVGGAVSAGAVYASFPEPLSCPSAGDLDGDGLLDLCGDPCPSDAGNTCNGGRSGCDRIGAGGGSFTTSDGSVTVDVPAGALAADENLCITDSGEPEGFKLSTDFGIGRTFFAVTLAPEGQTFGLPVVVTLSWPDVAPADGRIDGTEMRELALTVMKDRAPIVKVDALGNELEGQYVGRCGAEPGPLESERAYCSPTGDTFAFYVTSFSEFALFETQSKWSVFGTAEGGKVAMRIDGVKLSIPTEAGQSAATVAANVAAAINADATLASLGITAAAVGNRLTTNGRIESTVIADPGLTDSVPVPSLSPWSLALLVALLTGSARFLVTRHARRPG